MPRFNRTSLSIALILLLAVAFITGFTVKFYASFLFLFYSITEHMVFSVILLGVFQTILLIPIRILNLRQAGNIDAIKKEVEEIDNEDKKYSIFRSYFESGNITTLFYSVSFYVQLISFISIGRLFLTDFYTVRLAEDALFSFVPYPIYPIQDTIYSIPYIFPTGFIDSGWLALIVVWLVIIGIKIVSSYVFRSLIKKYGEQKLQAVELNPIARGIISLFSEYSLLLLIVAWFVIRHFPIGWEIRTLIGDVMVPNTPFNTVTATITFITVLWLNRNPINEKLATMKEAGASSQMLERERTMHWRSTFINALLIGLAAFFMTNQIPSAFELSVFTLEIIALTTPFTLDPLIKRVQGRS